MNGLIMKSHKKQWQRLVAGSVGSLMATTAVSTATAASPPNPNRFNASGRFLFNISAEFMHLATPINPDGAKRVYDNGYLNVDDSGNARTWDWGFQSGVAGDQLNLRAVYSSADGTIQRQSDDPQYGFELSYGRVLRTFDMGGAKPLNVGLMGAFGMTMLDIRNNSTIKGLTTGVTDTYDLSGLPIIPDAPFSGSAPTPGGPWPLMIPDAPSPSVDHPMATATERMKVDGNLYGFKVGPFFELPLGQVFAVQVQGGFAALLADTTFTYSETIDIGGRYTGSRSKNEWRYGGFVEGQVSVSLGRGWSAFAGAGWQDVGNYTLSDGNKAARVRLDNIISAFTGLSYAF